MDTSGQLALVVHVIGFTFWVGSLFTVALMMASAGEDAGRRTTIGALARRLAMTADIGAALAIVGGLSLLASRTWDLHQPWMHIKLTFAVGLIAVHGIVRARAKRLAGGAPPPKAGAAIAVALLAAAIVAVVVLKPMAR
jgi:uncharacterized membrane protein